MFIGTKSCQVASLKSKLQQMMTVKAMELGAASRGSQGLFEQQNYVKNGKFRDH
jgi:hypothetical protein